ncbi:MAG: hypothetical protein KDA90_24605, partial [Planctomycetaceae bacterium]|nr:hypothetical protein [Planctomycetaceae bacterium]
MSWDGPENPFSKEKTPAKARLESPQAKRPLTQRPAALLPEGVDPTIHFFWGLLIAHVLLWSILPMLMHHNPSR